MEKQHLCKIFMEEDVYQADQAWQIEYAARTEEPEL